MQKKSKRMLKAFWDDWYFIRQDIVSYIIPTLIYVFLYLMVDFTIASVINGIFECFVFYLPFWYTRICFSDTYHSDNWNHCKMWTRIMLCSGVFVLWLFPIQYSLIGGISIALICNIILYLVALETNEKKTLKRENAKLQSEISAIINKNESPKDKLLRLCAEKNISQRDTEVAVMYYINRMKPKQIWHWLCNNGENMEYDSVYILLNRLNKKLK